MAIRLILAREGHEIVGECENGRDAINQTLELKPDVVILDLDIPLIDGMTVIHRIRTEALRTRVLVYTSMKNPVYSTQCLRAGASAFLSKVGDPGEIIPALLAVAAGKSYFPIDTIDSVRRSDFAEDDEQLLKRLSRRELRVLLGLAQGKSNMLIAREMLLSNKTVSTYKSRIMQKLNNATLLELVEFARRNQLI
ncbi:two-component system response regulator EvgA [Pseudomonas sp. 3296]|nr:two-component system response regulator EvgA [Pseudomonas sp. 3296]